MAFDGLRLRFPSQLAPTHRFVHEFWIDGHLETRREGLDFVGTYTDYAINAVFFENYWNAGSPVEQERYFDNIVVSTHAIGCN